MTTEASQSTTVQISVTVNGESRAAEVEPRLLLVHFIRETLNLTGTHIGCDTTHCGACTVLLDGRPVKSCTIFAVQADGRDVKTVESLASRAAPSIPSRRHSPRSTACSAASAPQGMMLTGVAFLESNPDPNRRTEIRQAISGNLCRCTGYVNIIKAYQSAAAKLRERGA